MPAGTVQLGTSVAQIERAGTGWRLTLHGSGGPVTSETFNAVILATPAYRAATLLNGVDAELAADLAGIEYAGSAVISVVFRRAAVAHPLDGFGFVVPAIEQRRILSASFSSVKFPGRAPDDKVLIRVFMGGVSAPILELGDAELKADCDRRVAITDRRSGTARLLRTAPLAALRCRSIIWGTASELPASKAARRP